MIFFIVLTVVSIALLLGVVSLIYFFSKEDKSLTTDDAIKYLAISKIYEDINKMGKNE